MSSNAVPTKKIVDLMRAEAGADLKILKLTMFTSFSDLYYKYSDIEQVLQVLPASLAAATNAKKDPRGCNIFCTLFRVEQSSMEINSGFRFQQTVLNTARLGSMAMLDITSTSVPEIHMFFHTIAMVKKAFEQRF